MVGDSCHRHFVPLCQGDPQYGSPFLGILLKQLIKIPKAKEEQGIRRQLVPHFAVLLHHRSELGSLNHVKK